MITMWELNKEGYPTTPEIDDNLKVLHERINAIRTLWDKPMIVTSGLRSWAHQLRLINEGKTKATHSKHLEGKAVDILDKDGSLCIWLKKNPIVLKGAELWCEEGTDGWVHFQTIPPNSGKRWFWP